jgi:hypothetical protein
MTEHRQTVLLDLYAEDDRLTEEMNRIRRIRSGLRQRIQAEEAILRQAALLARLKKQEGASS